MDQFDEQLSDVVDATVPFREGSALIGPRNGDSMEGADSLTGIQDSAIYTDDPVRVYLREMGSVPLLTRQGEVDLARRMERGKTRSIAH